MRHIQHNIKTNNYYSETFIGKYAYIKKTIKDVDIHQIFKITGLDPEDNMTYMVEKYFYFCIPQNKNIKCFCYTGKDRMKYDYKDEMYILDDDEYLNTFREFVKNDGKTSNEIPSKLIQDKVVL